MSLTPWEDENDCKREGPQLKRIDTAFNLLKDVLTETKHASVINEVAQALKHLRLAARDLEDYLADRRYSDRT